MTRRGVAWNGALRTVSIPPHPVTRGTVVVTRVLRTYSCATRHANPRGCGSSRGSALRRMNEEPECYCALCGPGTAPGSEQEEGDAISTGRTASSGCVHRKKHTSRMRASMCPYSNRSAAMTQVRIARFEEAQLIGSDALEQVSWVLVLLTHAGHVAPLLSETQLQFTEGEPVTAEMKAEWKVVTTRNGTKGQL